MIRFPSTAEVYPFTHAYTPVVDADPIFLSLIHI